MICNSSFDYEV